MIFLIDFENVHEDGFNVLGRLGDKDAVYCFFTRNVAKISMSALASIKSGQMHFIEAESGKQSLDLVLVSYLGYLIGTRPQEMYYEIVSNDNGFNKVAEFWNKCGNGVRVRIRKTNDNKAKMEAPKPQSPLSQERAEQTKQQQIIGASKPVQAKQEPSDNNQNGEDTVSSSAPAGRQKMQSSARQSSRRRQSRTSDRKLQNHVTSATVQAESENTDENSLAAKEKNDAEIVIPVEEKSYHDDMTKQEVLQSIVSADNLPAVQKESKELAPDTIAALESSGINSSDIDFLQAQIDKFRNDKNMKQLVYRAVVKKYGQKTGTQIYNTAKKLIMK